MLCESASTLVRLKCPCLYSRMLNSLCWILCNSYRSVEEQSYMTLISLHVHAV